MYAWQFVGVRLYGDDEPNNSGHGNNDGHTRGWTRSTGTQRVNGWVSRVRHAVDDGGGVATFTCGCGVPDEPRLEGPGLQPDSCGVVRLLSARHDSAGVLFPGWCGTAVFHCQPHREGCALHGIILARAVAFTRVNCVGRIPSLHGPFHDLFHV